MKEIRTQDAVGQMIAHDMTQIIPGVSKGPRFKKGHIITEEDIPVLLSMGKEHIYIWERQAGFLHENEAAERLAALCLGENIGRTGISEGKIELIAQCDGLFRVDVERLDRLNAMDDITIATRRGDTAVGRGDKLAGTRVIPLVIEEEKVRRAEEAAGDTPVLSLHPWALKTAGVVTTGAEVASGRIEDKFTPVLVEKLAPFGVEVTAHVTVADDMEQIVDAIQRVRAEGVDMVLCTGGMSVDPDDMTPGAIARSGAEIVAYGTPVLPGAMLLLGYFGDGTPILGLPGGVMFARATVFDLLLPRIVAGVPVSRGDITRLGHGGLCLGCDQCHYPICPFGG